jgi:hypothetical protein
MKIECVTENGPILTLDNEGLWLWSSSRRAYAQPVRLEADGCAIRVAYVWGTDAHNEWEEVEYLAARSEEAAAEAVEAMEKYLP